MISSRIAEVNNAGGAFAGSITAALFLQRFVRQAKAWAHLDIYGWAPEARVGRPLAAPIRASAPPTVRPEQRYS